MNQFLFALMDLLTEKRYFISKTPENTNYSIIQSHCDFDKDELAVLRAHMDARHNDPNYQILVQKLLEEAMN